jgi:2-polyprenyl-3-methyl-5-hydroxy-6-metoxy-1,4-benzoquinol methylase/spore coat polysaccharide biosynthesis predicted glycosyltransferase SpsG
VNRGPVLAVPARERGRGGGHLVRCAALVRDLRALGREAWLLLPDDGGIPDGVLSAVRFDGSWTITGAALGDKKWDLVILDRFQTPPEEFFHLAGLAPLVGIDEGGPCRDRFDFLIDILPGLYGRSRPNIADPSLLPLPEKKQGPGKRDIEGAAAGRVKILVSFGQEDAAALGPAAAEALAAKNGAGLLDITLLSGGLSRGIAAAPAGVRVLGSVPRLGERLAEYDLLVTHYGITAFEALYAGTPVVLVSPTALHEKLALAAGFRSAGPGKKGALKLARMLFNGNELDGAFLRNLKTRCAALAAGHGLDREPARNLAALINGFTPPARGNCPVCGAPVLGLRVFGRGPERSFRRCGRCGAIGMIRLTPPPVEYGREYFFDLYQKQYGKTYIEDFPNLIGMGKRRLAVIASLIPAAGGAGKPLLLDIGCAYGPFLAAAREAGFSPAGVDPAEDAVRYVRRELGIPAAAGFFPGCPIPPPAGFAGGAASPLFDAVTLWYVIEHFRDCLPVFAAIRRILKPGGVLAFSTPSFSGVSGRSSPARFLAQSPADHWTVWSPSVCKKALARAGFAVKKIVISGHHPERFPLAGAFARNSRGPLYGPLLAASKICGLGDTFEVYAVAADNCRG